LGERADADPVAPGEGFGVVLVQPLVFYDGIRVINGRDDEDPGEEEEDPIAPGVTILLASWALCKCCIGRIPLRMIAQ